MIYQHLQIFERAYHGCWASPTFMKRIKYVAVNQKIDATRLPCGNRLRL